jgi:hypothetical protein
MLNWPDWNKLYANWQCLYFWVPFSDEQWKAIDWATNDADKNELIRKFREEYLKGRDIVTWELKKPVEEKKVEETKEDVEIEESIEDVKPAKPTKKKGK